MGKNTPGGSGEIFAFGAAGLQVWWQPRLFSSIPLFLMFGFFLSQHHKTRRLAADWLELADKVFNYRRDVLGETGRADLMDASGVVRQLLREKADMAKLKLGIDGLERVLRRHGGSHYPKSGLVENVEFFLVAAIVILGLRSFYVQPFKIPTNSM